jgi:hydrogenase-4 component H
MILSKLKEAIICFRAGRVTLPYPFAPAPPEEGFRGKLAVEVESCVGCGGCAEVCPPRAIVVHDTSPAWRTVEFFLERCTYCGRCAEVCPEKAITMTREFETATDNPEDLHVRMEIYMGTCQRCGRCFPPPSTFDRIMQPGFRDGDPAKQEAGKEA